jgi:hypothetical protein
MSTDELVDCYGLAARLKSYGHGPSLDIALRLWMFRAQRELKNRGQLERIRDWLPVYFDPTRRTPVYGPGAALHQLQDDPTVPQVAKPLRQLTG